MEINSSKNRNKDYQKLPNNVIELQQKRRFSCRIASFDIICSGHTLK